jgi:long-subunit acyl-CoA synthetase (AMP-forming)
VPLYQDSIEKEVAYIVDHAEARFAVVEDQEPVANSWAVARPMPSAARDRRDLTGETHGVSSSCSRPWRAGRAAARWAAAGRRRETPR